MKDIFSAITSIFLLFLKLQVKVILDEEIANLKSELK